jgi:hypothetical protein
MGLEGTMSPHELQMTILHSIEIIVVAGILYLAPSLFAYHRSNYNTGAVVVVNLFLGWTFIGWVVALAMALGGRKKGHA